VQHIYNSLKPILNSFVFLSYNATLSNFFGILTLAEFQIVWLSEDRASWHILIIKANDMHYFSNLFWKELYVFRTDLLSIIRSLKAVYTAIVICHTSSVDCLLAVASRQSTELVWQITIAVYTALRLLMMDSKSVRNT